MLGTLSTWGNFEYNTFSIKQQAIWSPSKGKMVCLFNSRFLQATVAGTVGIDFLRKFKITVATEISQVLFARAVGTPVTTLHFLPSSSQHSAGMSAMLADAALPPRETYT